MVSFNQKLMISLGSAAVFVLVNLPQTYKITNGLLGGLIGPLTTGGCPTTLGLLVHAAVFYLITRLSMSKSYGDEHLKTRRSLVATVIMLVLSSPMMYKLVRSVLGTGIASATGCATLQGVLTHGAVYTGVLIFMMSPQFDRYF